MMRSLFAQPWVLVVIMTIFSLIIRLWRIDFQSFWLDEAHTAFYLNGQTPRVIWERLTRPGENGPVYYVLLACWRLAFGGNEVSLRSFSVLSMTIAIPLTWLAMRRMIPIREALVTTALVAFAPYITWYAQEAKMYALAMFAGLLVLGLLLEAVHRGGAWRWAAYGIAALCSIYIQFFALLSIGSHAIAVVVLLWPNRRPLVAAWATMALVLVPVLVWQAVAISRDVAGSGASMSSGEMSLPTRVGVLAYAYLMNVTPAPLPIIVFSSIVIAIFGTVACLAPAAGSLRQLGIPVIWGCGFPAPVRGPLTLAILAWSPFVAHAIAMDALGAGLFADRYFIATVPMLCGIAAIAFGLVVDRTKAGAVVLAVVLVLVGAWATIFQVSVPIKDDFRRVMALYRGGKGDRDAVVPIPQYLSYPVGYHSAPGLDVVIVDMERPPVDYASKFSGRTGVWVVTNVPDRFISLRGLREWLVAHASLASEDTVTGGVNVQHWVFDGGCVTVVLADGTLGAPSFERPCLEGVQDTPQSLFVR